MPTELYHLWRIAERWPAWIGRPEDFFLLDEDTQALLMIYEAIRQTEEARMRAF